MTNSKSTNYGHVIMDVAVHLRGRTPIASALLGNGLGKVVHVLELQDGECILMNRDLKHPKCSMKNGQLTVVGQSSFVGWESRNDSLKNITSNAIKVGFQEIFSKRTNNLPLLQMPMDLTVQKVA